MGSWSVWVIIWLFPLPSLTLKLVSNLTAGVSSPVRLDFIRAVVLPDPSY